MTVIEEIAVERRRQISEEVWTPHHDDTHDRGQLAKAAASYAVFSTLHCIYRGPNRLDCESEESAWARHLWPWEDGWWKPSTPRRELIKAAALIVAEIERLDRLQ